MTKITFGLLVVVSWAAVANEPGAAPDKTKRKAGEIHGPCKAVVAACEGAGYYEGGAKEKKGLWVNCAKPLVAGETVAGVTVAAADLQACREEKAKEKKK